MSEIKKNRKLKVYYQWGSNSKQQPVIRVGGDWLKKLGFEVGDPVEVECSDGKLVISKSK